MKILVTGGAGFIGSHIVDRLVSMGADVVVIDDESAIAHDQFYYNDMAEYYKWDISDYDKIRSLFNNTDYVFHLAALPSVEYSVKNPSYTLKHNVLATSKLLEWAKDNNVKRVIFSSSSAIYGQTQILSTSETKG